MIHEDKFGSIPMKYFTIKVNCFTYIFHIDKLNYDFEVYI